MPHEAAKGLPGHHGARRCVFGLQVLGKNSQLPQARWEET